MTRDVFNFLPYNELITALTRKYCKFLVVLWEEPSLSREWTVVRLQNSKQETTTWRLCSSFDLLCRSRTCWGWQRCDRQAVPRPVPNSRAQFVFARHCLQSKAWLPTKWTNLPCLTSVRHSCTLWTCCGRNSCGEQRQKELHSVHRNQSRR